MSAITAPFVEVTQVVTGFMYQLQIAEEDGSPGITKLDIGPYFFDGVLPRVAYPEAVTNEMAPPGWQPVRWRTDAHGQSWLTYEGGVLAAEDGEAIFQFTSNHGPSANANAHLVVWRGSRSETFDVPLPDYSVAPPAGNTRRDTRGMGSAYRQVGCLPQLILSGAILSAAAWIWVR